MEETQLEQKEAEAIQRMIKYVLTVSKLNLNENQWGYLDWLRN